MSDKIADLAEFCGAKLQTPLGAGEIISFRLRSDGGITVATAGGECIDSCPPDELPDAFRDAAKEIMATISRVVPGGKIQPEITYHRRQTELAEGLFGIAFTEAGR